MSTEPPATAQSTPPTATAQPTPPTATAQPTPPTADELGEGEHSPTTAAPAGALRLVWVYPDLLSTYGDRGNLLILARRAERRGIAVDSVEVRSDQPLPPDGDIYLLGGGEDGPQALAAARLVADGELHRAAARGSVVFAVCAGYQLLGQSFFAKGTECSGLGLLDLRSDRGPTRAVGELAGTVDPTLGLPTLTGFENHGGRTHLGPEATPLARVRVGVGNDGATEGAWHGSVLGTYLHGPALARNPALADLLLRWALRSRSATSGLATGAATSALPDLAEIDDQWPQRLRAERLNAVGAR